MYNSVFRDEVLIVEWERLSDERDDAFELEICERLKVCI